MRNLHFIFFICFFFLSANSFAQFTASIGIQASHLEVESHSDFDSLSYDQSSNDQATGVSGELALGYRYQLNEVYDIDLDLFSQLLSTETDIPVIAGTNPFGVTNGDAEIDWLWGVRVRPGYRVTDTTRLFIDLGLVWGDFEAEFSPQAVDTTGIDSSKSRTLGGFRYGVGVERNITDYLVISLDGTATHFESTDIDDITLEDTDNHRTRYTPSLYTLGLNLKVLFGGDWF